MSGDRMKRFTGPSVDEIVDRLRDNIEGVLDHYYPGWVAKKGDAYPAYVSNKDPGSFVVRLRDKGKQRRGDWHRYSEGQGGSPLALIAYAMSGSCKPAGGWGPAIREAKAFLGIENERADPEAADRRARKEAARRSDRERRAQEDAARRLAFADVVWQSCAPLPGTLGERYLESRGLRLPEDHHDLRFHPNLEHPEGGRHPALVAGVRNGADELVGVWRIYLAPNGMGKADVQCAKLGLGLVAGAAVQLGGIAPTIGIAEGVETALACRELYPRYPVWAGLSTSGVTSFIPPEGITRIIVYPDGDLPHRRPDGEAVMPGLLAAVKLRERLGNEYKVDVCRPPSNGDFLDVLNLRKQVDGAA